MSLNCGPSSIASSPSTRAAGALANLTWMPQPLALFGKTGRCNYPLSSLHDLLPRLPHLKPRCFSIAGLTAPEIIFSLNTQEHPGTFAGASTQLPVAQTLALAVRSALAPRNLLSSISASLLLAQMFTASNLIVSPNTPPPSATIKIPSSNFLVTNSVPLYAVFSCHPLSVIFCLYIVSRHPCTISTCPSYHFLLIRTIHSFIIICLLFIYRALSQNSFSFQTGFLDLST
jgi:hypothetical protein